MPGEHIINKKLRKMKSNPKSWSDITIEQYIRLYEIQTNEFSDDIDKEFATIMLLYNLKEEEVNNILIEDYNKMKEEMSFLSKEPNQTKFKEIIEIDGITYRYNLELNKITLGEWIDLETYNKDFINNIHKIASILVRKDGITKYDVIEARNSASIFYKKMNIEDALAFFLHFYLFAQSFIPSDIVNCSNLDKTILMLTQQMIELKEEKRSTLMLKKKKRKPKKTSSG